jgi:hypothetical protein
VGATGPFRAEGEVELGSGALAIDKLKAEVDRMAIEGRLAYSWMSGDRPPRIEAVLSTPDIDLDRAYALAQGVFADTTFEWPREGALAITLGRAAVAGVEARRAEVNVQFDERGLAIERLAIGDFGGAALAVKGRIDTHLSSPRGAVTFDLDARALNGVAALIEKFSPPTAEQLRAAPGASSRRSSAVCSRSIRTRPPRARLRSRPSPSRAAPAPSGSTCKATRAAPATP